MRFLSQIRTGGLRFPVLFLGVGLCVFVWGLRYKLSLYDPPHAVSHNIPTAKILSRDDLPESLKPAVRPADGGKFAAPQLLPMLLFAMVPLSVARTRRFPPLAAPQLPSRARILECAGLGSFLFRPPPAAIPGLSWSR